MKLVKETSVKAKDSLKAFDDFFDHLVVVSGNSEQSDRLKQNIKASMFRLFPECREGFTPEQQTEILRLHKPLSDA